MSWEPLWCCAARHRWSSNTCRTWNAAAPHGELDLEQHGGQTFESVAIRVTQRVLAMAARIWHNNPIRARHSLLDRLRPLITSAAGLFTRSAYLRAGC